MGILLSATSLRFNAVCAFFAVMCIIGFLMIRVDKKRWNAQKARSDEMMAARKKKPAEDAEATENDGKKKKKKPQKEEPFEYQDRISEKAIFMVAILFGAMGVLLAMLVYRHKWYKFNFRVYIPLLAVVNVIIGAVILYFVYAYGTPVNMTIS